VEEDLREEHAVGLRKHGLQVTAQRLAVLRAIDRHPHGTADELERIVRGEIGTISRQSIYDTLTTLTDKGLLRRIQPAGSATRYEQRVDDNHHHLVCRRCARTVDVDCVSGEKPCLEVVDDQGFTIDEAEVIFWGICPLCQVGSRGAEQASTREIETHDHEGVR
jgi:Fur family ferric uptake transcriptional regulator